MISFQYVSSTSTLAQAFDSNNNLVASIGHDESVEDNFVGTLSGIGITRVLFSGNGGASNGPGITNLTFNIMAAAAPEPATWAMMILGLGIAGLSLRRRQKIAVRLSYTG